MKMPLIRLLCLIMLSVFQSLLPCQAEGLAYAHLPPTKFKQQLPLWSSEILNYKLSYRGLLTSMIWADIAHARISFVPDTINYNDLPGHQLKLWISTENFKTAELIHPVRYDYTAMMDTLLERVLFIEEQDTGASQAHEVLWLDWQNKKSELYRRREKHRSFGSMLQGRPAAWEKDNNKPIPPFLLSQTISLPDKDKVLSYFIHKESGDDISYEKVFDPLSLIYQLRRRDFMLGKKTEVAVAVGNDIRIYLVERQGKDEVVLDSRPYQAIKYHLHTASNTKKHFFMWLSDDGNRVPLKFVMQAPLGKLVVLLQQEHP